MQTATVFVGFRHRPSAATTATLPANERPSAKASIFQGRQIHRYEQIDDPVRVLGLPWIVMTSALSRKRNVEKRPGMPSTWYVNNGTGLWPGFALRLGRPSELTRITLRRADAI
jgi:hypothetical protein